MEPILTEMVCEYPLQKGLNGLKVILNAAPMESLWIFPTPVWKADLSGWRSGRNRARIPSHVKKTGFSLHEALHM